MILELILCLLVCLFFWDYLFKKHPNDIIEKSRIGGPKAWPIIGNALEFKDIDINNNVQFIRDNNKKYGKVHRFWMLHQLHVIISDAKYLELILSSQQLINKSFMYNFLESWLGTGLLMSTGKKWHTRRKIITPTFHFKILEQFVEIFDQQSAVMVEKLQEKADGKKDIDIFPVMCLLALDIIAETAMGVTVNAQKNPGIGYVKALRRVATITGDRFIKPAQQIDWLFLLLKPREYFEFNKCIRVMHEFTDRVIQERREALQKSINEGTYEHMDDDIDNVGSKKRLALLDVLLQSTVAGSPLSNEDIREEVDTFMFEGHDTTTSGISFCLYLISRHPVVQQKLIEEIHAVIGDDKTRPVTLKLLQELKYLDCVIKESMRIYPPVSLIGRQTTEDVTLGDITIPANTSITLQLFIALQDADYFADPLSFKPERFNSENGDKINPFAYVPFSAGPRNCIGQKFAVLEMKSTISKILRHYELLPSEPPVHPAIDLVLRSATGVHMVLKPRK